MVEDGMRPDPSAAPGGDDNGTRTLGDAARDREDAKAGIADLTEEEVRKLARKEIERWHADAPKLFQPKTWGVVGRITPRVPFQSDPRGARSFVPV